MSGNDLGQGIRANEAALAVNQHARAEAKASDAMLFKDYLSGGQQSIKPDQSNGTGMMDPTRSDGNPTRSHGDYDPMAHFNIFIRDRIDSGLTEFPSSASAEDRYNAFMFSDTIRYNFETETVQVLAESHVGGLGWQNIGDVSPQLASNVMGDIATLINNRNQTTSVIADNFPSHEATSAGEIFSNTQVSISEQQSDSDETASVIVSTQAPLGSGVDSLNGSTQPELEPNSILSWGNGENVSTTYFTDDNGNLMVADINLQTGNAMVSDEAGNTVMTGTVNTVTGETNFTDTNGEVVAAEDSPIGTTQLPTQLDPNGYPNTMLEITVVDQTVNFVQTPVDGSVGQNFYDQNGELVPEPPRPTMPDGSTPRPPEITIPAGTITVSTNDSESGVTTVGATVNPENGTIESSGVDANGNEIFVVSHPSSGISMVVDSNTGDTLAYVHVDPGSGVQAVIDSNGQLMDDSPYLNTYRPPVDMTVTIDGHPSSAVRVTLPDGTLLYHVHILDDVGQDTSMYVTGPDGLPLLAGVRAPYPDRVPVVPNAVQTPAPDNTGTETPDESPPPLNLTTDAAYENQQEDLPVDYSTDGAWDEVNQQTGQGTTQTTQTGGSGASTASRNGSDGSGGSPASAASPASPASLGTGVSPVGEDLVSF